MNKRSTITVKSPAKINLRLKVGHRREDGFHEVQTILAPIDWTDTLTLEAIPGAAGNIALEVTGAPGIPVGPDNLAHRAAQTLIDHYRPSEGVRLSLDKNIPAGAGLGGGSGNAAATLLGLNRLWGLGLTVTDLELLAAQLGSDVPFFLQPGPCTARGRGEILAPIELPEVNLLVVVPPVPSATPDAYRALARSLTHSEEWVKLPSRIETVEALLPLMENDLQEPVAERIPQVAEALQLLEPHCALAMMSGSGSAVIALEPDDSVPTFPPDWTVRRCKTRSQSPLSGLIASGHPG